MTRKDYAVIAQGFKLFKPTDSTCRNQWERSITKMEDVLFADNPRFNTIIF